MLGFHADRDLALRELEAARKSNCIRSTEASVLIALFSGFFLEKKTEADEILVEMMQKFP
jgi:hypothetical protein